jgi:hypothetical protein
MERFREFNTLATRNSQKGFYTSLSLFSSVIKSAFLYQKLPTGSNQRKHHPWNDAWMAAVADMCRSPLRVEEFQKSYISQPQLLCPNQ